METPGRKHFMLRAIKLAKKAEGKTYPNPMVGACVVKDGMIVGEGYHRRAGQEHAETIALKKAGINSNGADLYVTLEPCAHHGRTPPCVDAIQESGVRKVYAAMKDPNSLVNGSGIKRLREHGIKVRVGLCLREATVLNESYINMLKDTDVYRDR